MTSRSPNIGGKLSNPRFLVVHFTASGTTESAVSWLCNRRAKASAHFVVGREGEVVQLVDTSRVAWAQGQSVYKGVTRLNSHSISVELVAWGPLKKTPEGFKPIVGTAVIPPEDVMLGKHKSGLFGYEAWHRYTEAQIQALGALTDRLFVEFPSLREVFGHEDCSIGRKADPGVAAEGFMAALQAKYNRI